MNLRESNHLDQLLHNNVYVPTELSDVYSHEGAMTDFNSTSEDVHKSLPSKILREIPQCIPFSGSSFGTIHILCFPESLGIVVTKSIYKSESIAYSLW